MNQVALNRFVNGEPENDTACEKCGELRSVNKITKKRSEIVLVSLCEKCLEEARMEIILAEEAAA